MKQGKLYPKYLSDRSADVFDEACIRAGELGRQAKREGKPRNCPKEISDVHEYVTTWWYAYYDEAEIYIDEENSPSSSAE